MSWALISQTDHSASGVSVDPSGLIATMSSGHCRLDQSNTNGKRQVDCLNGGGAAQIVVCLCRPASGIDDAINSAEHYTYDGTGYLSIPPGWDGGGHVTIAAGAVVSLVADLNAHTVDMYKNGVLIGGWVGLAAGAWTVLFGSTTAIASAGLTIYTDPDDFLFPVLGATGFGGAPPAAGGNFLPLL